MVDTDDVCYFDSYFTKFLPSIITNMDMCVMIGIFGQRFALWWWQTQWTYSESFFMLGWVLCTSAKLVEFTNIYSKVAADLSAKLSIVASFFTFQVAGNYDLLRLFVSFCQAKSTTSATFSTSG